MKTAIITGASAGLGMEFFRQAAEVFPEIECFWLIARRQERLEALAAGKPVTLYTPGLPSAPGNRALSAALAASRREMKAWGIVFTDGAQRKLITAQEARALKAAGKYPAAGAVLTPLAREIFEQ